MSRSAGRAVALEVQRLAPPDASIAVVCGGGNNGGDGFVCARWLGAWGRDVTVFLAAPRPDPGGEAGFHLALCERMGGVVVPITSAAELAHADLDADVIVDALLGTGLATDVRPHHVQVIEAMNRAPALRIAVDVPSGLDADTGQPRGAAVRAHHTVTLGFAKLGLAGDPGLLYAGQILSLIHI